MHHAQDVFFAMPIYIKVHLVWWPWSELTTLVNIKLINQIGVQVRKSPL